MLESSLFYIFAFSLQHPAHRMRLSQILNHPFMRDHSTVQSTQTTPLLASQALMKGTPHSYSQASLDSGQYTMSSSSQSVNRSGPMKATVRPQGIEHHISSSVSSTSRTHSRHQSSSSVQSQKPLSHRKTHSVDGTQHTKQSSRGSQKSSQLTGSRHQSMSCEDLRYSNKENLPTHTHKRRAKSDFEPSRATPPLLKDQSRGVSSSQVPFRDKTNVARSVGREERKVRATTAAPTAGSLKELVPPLNAARLRPIKQQTRSAIVSGTLSFMYS